MDHGNLFIAILGHALSALAYLATIPHLLRRAAHTKDAALWHLVASTIATVLWAGAVALATGVNSPANPWLADGIDTLRLAAWSLFLIHLLCPPPHQSRSRWPDFAVSTLILVRLSALGGVAVLPETASVALRIANYAGIGQAILGLILLEQLVRNGTADARWNLKPLLIGLFALFGYDLYYFSLLLLFNQIDVDSFVVRPLAQVVLLPLLWLTLERSRGRPLRLSFSQAAAFHTTALAAAGLYLVLAAAAGYYVRYLGGEWGRALQLALLFLAVLVLALIAFSGSTRAKLRVFVSKHFFRYRYDYREEWLKFTRTLSSAENTSQIGANIIKGLADMVESPGGALWSSDADRHVFLQSARWNMPASTATEPADGPLASFLQESGWVINLEELRHRPSRYRDFRPPAWLSDYPNAWLVVPLQSPQGLVGFVVLATARAAIEIDWEVNDLLRTAGRQAAAFLAQIQASEALLEARKFEAFNRMSAFVVHDLKNIVSQLSLLLHNAERHADNPEFQRDMLHTIRHSVERMKQLMMQLREGTRAIDGSAGVDLAALLERVCKSKEHQRPSITVEIGERLFARGDPERIERVIGHLVQNALDATPSEGRVWLQLRRHGGMAEIEVGDTGCGMSPEFIRERLFKPFATTKESGMGIGAYESRQYVREIGGDIRVESEENVGTRFHVLLPILDIAPPLHDSPTSP